MGRIVTPCIVSKTKLRPDIFKIKKYEILAISMVIFYIYAILLETCKSLSIFVTKYFFVPTG